LEKSGKIKKNNSGFGMVVKSDRENVFLKEIRLKIGKKQLFNYTKR